MGSTPAYFSVYPLPAKVPTNAAILASKYAVGPDADWSVTVLDGKQAVEVRVQPFASAAGPGGTFAISPVHGWPPGRALEVVARLGGDERRHPFKTAKTDHRVPPHCDWTGPVTIHPKPSTPEPELWPTNMPRPPRNLRTFPVPSVHSLAGYMVAARLCVTDRGRTWAMEIAMPASTAPSEPSAVSLTPPYGDEFSDAAQVIGMELTDVAGNVARYGTTG